MKLVIKPNETTIVNQVIKRGSFLQNLRIKEYLDIFMIILFQIVLCDLIFYKDYGHHFVYLKDALFYISF